MWGKNDPFFLPPGAEAFKRDIPDAVVRFFDTGHFALETHAAEIAAAIRDFLPADPSLDVHDPSEAHATKEIECRSQLPSSPGPARASARPPPSASRATSRRWSWSRANRANLEQTAEAVRAAGAEALVIDADLPQPEAAQAVVDQTLAAFGRIDALLNIAGAVPQIDLFEMTDAQWEGGLALKLHGARRLTIAAWPALKAAKGSVVLMSGNSALFPKAPYAAVGTINAAIVALAKAFSDRGIADGVQVNSVLPGPVMTGRRRSYLAALGAAARHDGGGGDGQLPEGGRHRALWRAGGDRRADGVPRVARRPLDDRLDASHGRRRGEVDLVPRDGPKLETSAAGETFLRQRCRNRSYDMAALPLIVFDVNETLLDLQSMEPIFERIFGDKMAMRLWFANLIMYSAALTLADCYVPFTDIGSAVMKMLADTQGIKIDDADKQELTEKFSTMPPHREVPAALRKLRDAGFRLFTLTDNLREVQTRQLEHGGIVDLSNGASAQTA